MEGEMHKTVRIHGVENLPRVRQILNGQPLTPQTVEEVLAAESLRLGVKLEIKKEGKDG